MKALGLIFACLAQTWGYEVRMTRDYELERHADAGLHQTELRNPTVTLSMLLLALNSAAAWQVFDAGPRGGCRFDRKVSSCPCRNHFRSCHSAAPKRHCFGTKVPANRFGAHLLVSAHDTACFRQPSCVVARHMALRMQAKSDTGTWLEKVQKEFLEEVELEQVATLVELPVMFTDESQSSIFDVDKWVQHRGTARYGRLLIGILLGVTTRRIAGTVALLTLFSGLVGLYSAQANILQTLPELELPLTPFELTAPVLGLLLVFRTNTAYERFDRGSDAAWQLTNRIRSTMCQLALYTSGPQTPRTEQEVSKELIDACCVLHEWLMVDYLRGDQASGKTRELLQLTLGERGQALSEHEVLAKGLTPTAARAAFGVALKRKLPSLGETERVTIDAQLDGLISSLGICEKLLCTPIPLGYTRYSVRFLWIWLTLLPFALANSFSNFGVDTWWADKPQPVLCLAILFIGFIFLSIEDIAAQIEEPFTILPLERHQDWILREAKQIKLLMQSEALENQMPEPSADTSTL